jgi:hypothetical protein
VRRILAVLAAIAVAGLGGAIFGEQPFSGVLGATMGGLLGLFVAEAALLAAGEEGVFTTVTAVIAALAGTALAVAISTAWLDVYPLQLHSRHEPLPGGGWAALAAAVAVAALVTGRRRRRTAPGSSPRP